jgi:hypothetical protein
LISPALALGYLGWRFWSGFGAIAGKHASPARIELVPARIDEVPSFTAACDELRALGFSPIGDFEVRLAVGRGTTQRTDLRAFLAPDGSAFAVVYELVSLTRLGGARTGAQKIWMELVSRRGENASLTTSNGEPPLALLDPNPERPVERLPGAPARELWAAHRALLGASFSELEPAEFVARFTQGWTRGFEFQQSRGLYARRGDLFVATGKLALRSVLEFHLRLRHRTGPRYAAGVVFAVAVAAAVCGVANLAPWPMAVPVAAALCGASFAALFRHFELPAALFVCALAGALGRDDGYAIAAFAVVLLQGAVMLQRRRAARAQARLAG